MLALTALENARDLYLCLSPKSYLVTLLNLQTDLFEHFIDFVIYYYAAIFRWKYYLVHQNADIMTLMDVPAHFVSLRRKRRGIRP